MFDHTKSHHDAVTRVVQINGSLVVCFAGNMVARDVKLIIVFLLSGCELIEHN